MLLLKTYYVVAQLGRVFREEYNETDYMLGTVPLTYCLLNTGIWNLVKDVNIVFSENNNKIEFLHSGTQSAGNQMGLLKSKDKSLPEGSSETIRQLSYNKFDEWLAGIMDGDGNFDLRTLNGKEKLKVIRIKLHVRDVRILNRILNKLHFGRLRFDKNNKHVMYVVSTKEDMTTFCKLINGSIRLKAESFIRACKALDLEYKEANYLLEENTPYFAGLVDTDGSIFYNYSSNRIECNLEFKLTKYSEKIDFSKVVPNISPYIIKRTHKNKSLGKIYYSIAFKYHNAGDMIWIYEYFMKNRLYSDFKFYRVSKIKEFITIRDYKKAEKNSIEYDIYCSFMLDFIQYKNPTWTRLTYIKYLLKDKEIVQ